MNDGLKIEIFPFTIDNEWSKFQYDFGFVVFVHNSSFSLTKEVFIKPGEKTFIQVERTFIQKQPKPYSDCIDLT